MKKFYTKEESLHYKSHPLLINHLLFTTTFNSYKVVGIYATVPIEFFLFFCNSSYLYTSLVVNLFFTLYTKVLAHVDGCIALRDFLGLVTTEVQFIG